MPSVVSPANDVDSDSKPIRVVTKKVTEFKSSDQMAETSRFFRWLMMEVWMTMMDVNGSDLDEDDATKKRKRGKKGPKRNLVHSVNCTYELVVALKVEVGLKPLRSRFGAWNCKKSRGASRVPRRFEPTVPLLNFGDYQAINLTNKTKPLKLNTVNLDELKYTQIALENRIWQLNKIPSLTILVYGQ
ncbi:hypothetical protein FQA39_LY07141 [Lamprigera yunnana]|nr:hypothetical protein FQA39_LY07141 [Lamprigera yunnana]